MSHSQPQGPGFTARSNELSLVLPFVCTCLGEVQGWYWGSSRRPWWSHEPPKALWLGTAIRKKRKTRLWLEVLGRALQSQYMERQRKQGLGKSEVGLNCIVKIKMLPGKRRNTD